MKYSAEKIREMAYSRELEVEHIISAAFNRDEGLAKELESLETELSWLTREEAAPKSKVPLADWADTAIRFIRKGYDGLRELPRSKLSFVAAFLAEYKEEESVKLLNEIAQDFGDSATPEEKNRIATAINLLLSFDDAPIIEEKERLELKSLLHHYYDSDIPENTRAAICCALRGVGGSDSIDLIKSRPKLTGPWAGVESTVVKAIRQRK